MAQVTYRQDQFAVLLAELLRCQTNGEASEELDTDDDEYIMYNFKIRRCPRARAHEWTSCPYAHPGEAARRRDPRRVAYSGEPCPDFRRRPGGACPRGAGCPFAHGTFEMWLHPSRYRTQPCRAGGRCVRPICFFAHSDRELRTVNNYVDMLSPRFPCTIFDDSSPPPCPTEAKRQLQPAVHGNMMGMDMQLIRFAIQEKARKAMRQIAPSTATLPQVMEEDESELGWVANC